MMTTITGLLLHADGEPANGQAVISWIAFQIHEVVIVSGQKMVEIIDGNFSVDLYPNITAHPHGVYYTVRMELDNGAVYEEFWIVPDAPSATVEQVRSSFPLEPGMAINPMQIAGSGAQAGMIITYNGSYWVPGYVSATNISPNWIQLDVGSSGDDFWIDGSPVQLGRIATINIPSASLTARGLVTTGAQSFAGDKTFAGRIIGNAQIENTSGGYKFPDGTVQLTAAPAFSGHVIQDEGIARSQRAALNFVGDGVSVTDDSANNRSVVTITGGASGSQTPWLSNIDGNSFLLTNVARISVGSANAPPAGTSLVLTDAVNSTLSIRHQATPVLNTILFEGTGTSRMVFRLGSADRVIFDNQGYAGFGTMAPANVLTVAEAQADATGASATQPNTIRRGLMIQGVFGSMDGACIQMGAGGGLGWHIKQRCDNGNEGPLMFYGASAAGNNLQQVAQFTLTGVTVFGNVNITGEYQFSGTNIKGAMQTPWLQSINAAQFGLYSASYVAINISSPAGPASGWPLWVSCASATALPYTVSATQSGTSISAATPNADRIETFVHRDAATPTDWTSASWYFRRIVDGSPRGFIRFSASGMHIGLAGLPWMDFGDTMHTIHRMTMVYSTNAGSDYSTAALQLQCPSVPRISFLIPGVAAAQIGIDNFANVCIYDNPGTGLGAFRCLGIDAGSYKTPSSGTACTIQGGGNAGGGSPFGTVPTANQILRTQDNAYLITYYINYTPAAESPGVANIFVDNSDGFIRKASAGHVAARLNGFNSPHTDAVPLAKYLTWNAVGGQQGNSIFDASGGIMPNGNPCSRTNSVTAWTDTYPTLMGYSVGSTYGVRVDSARRADSAASADVAKSLYGDIPNTNIGGANVNINGYTTINYNASSVPTCLVTNDYASAAAGTGQLQVSSASVLSAHFLFLCYSGAAIPRFAVRADGQCFMWLSGGFKALSVDGSGFVKAA